MIRRQDSTEAVGYQYDLQGNILQEAGIHGKTEYRYNAFNQQTAVLMRDGQVQENRYDAEELRAEIWENGRKSRFLYYNGELLAESEPDETVSNRYILGYGVAAGWQKEKEGYHSYHLDEQNSTAYITDEGQRIENGYQYDAFGGIRNRKEEVHNRILYTGQQHDQVTGQYYLRARYYNPVVGRFLQEDVYRGDGLNLYAYCANNPVVYYDPSGYEANSCKEENAEATANGNNSSNTGQVPYGSTDLSQQAIEYRRENEIYSARNVAVFEFAEGDDLRTITTVSERGRGNAERLAAKELDELGVDPARVIRIYSELEPCCMPGGYCKDFIDKTYPQANVTYSFEYGVEKDSRTRGLNALKEAINKIKK